MTAPAPPLLDRCAECGQPTSAPARCPHCGASLLVDVVLDPAPTDGRLLFKAARAAAEAGVVPGLDYAAARANLDRTGAAVATAVPRDRARALVSYLAIEGVPATVRPSTAVKPPARSRRVVLVASIAAALLAVGVAGALVARRWWQASSRRDAAATAPALPAPQAPAAPAAGASERAAVLSTAELARLARPALAVLTCRGKLGSGFFVDRDRILTNAHVTCGPGVALEVKLGDGRQLLGRVKTLDAWLDFAVVEVPGASVASPLALGDSTGLTAGDPVVLIGSPLGLEATVHEGKVSFVGRNLQGVAHVQLNADVNFGNSGGPLLDGRGRAVGIVTLKAENAGGVGFALPVEYALQALGAQPADDAARARWDGTLSRVREEDDAEAGRLVARLERPLPLAATATGGRLGLVVMQRFPGGPQPVTVTAEVRDGDRVLCESRGDVSAWTPIEQRFKEAAEQDRAGRKVRWMVRRGIASGTYAGGVEMDVARCPPAVPEGAAITVQGGGDEAVAFPASALEESRRAAEARGAVTARREAAAATRSEAAWRDAFRKARERVAKLEAKRLELLAVLDTQRDARRDLARTEADLASAREDLDTLERKASFEGVPREWR